MKLLIQNRYVTGHKELKLMHELVTMFGPIPRLIFDTFMDTVLPTSKYRNDGRPIAVTEGKETKGCLIPEGDQKPEVETDIFMTEDGVTMRMKMVTKMVVTVARNVGICLEKGPGTTTTLESCH